MKDIAVSSRVRLARNYEDLPFRGRITRDQSESCIQRTLDSLREQPEIYRLFLLRGADEAEQKALLESRLITPDLLGHDNAGAALIRQDEKISVLMNEEDHLRIQAFAPWDQLNEAAENALAIDDILQRHLSFAFDPQWGYLTACPTNTGTGMRASMILHLPMLTILKQMGKVNQLAAKLGLTLRGIYGEGSEAQGHLYQLSNQVTLGRTEKEIIEAVSEVAKQMGEMERSFREKAIEKDAAILEDQIFRSYGICRYARRMPLKEFMAHWSHLRLGAALEKLPLSLTACDALLISAQPGHLQREAGGALDEKEETALRSDFVRSQLNGGIN